MKTVLIMGAKGLLGNYTAKKFCDTGWNVFSIGISNCNNKTDS